MKYILLPLLLFSATVNAQNPSFTEQDIAQCVGLISVLGPEAEVNQQGAMKDWGDVVQQYHKIDYVENKKQALEYAHTLDRLGRQVAADQSAENEREFSFVFNKGWVSCQTMGLKQFQDIK